MLETTPATIGIPTAKNQKARVRKALRKGRPSSSIAGWSDLTVTIGRKRLRVSAMSGRVVASITPANAISTPIRNKRYSQRAIQGMVAAARALPEIAIDSARPRCRSKHCDTA